MICLAFGWLNLPLIVQVVSEMNGKDINEVMNSGMWIYFISWKSHVDVFYCKRNANPQYADFYYFSPQVSPSWPPCQQVVLSQRLLLPAVRLLLPPVRRLLPPVSPITPVGWRIFHFNSEFSSLLLHQFALQNSCISPFYVYLLCYISYIRVIIIK